MTVQDEKTLLISHTPIIECQTARRTDGIVVNTQSLDAGLIVRQLMTSELDPATVPLGALGDRLGITLTRASATVAIGTMPVEGNTQPFGLLNGGASLALAETLGSVAANIHAGSGRHAVGIEINGTHHRSATSGIVTGTATALTIGRTLAVYEIVVTDEKDRRLCTARLTCLLRDAD